MVKEFKKFLKHKEKDDFESFSIFEIIPLLTYFYKLYRWYTNKKIQKLLNECKIELLKVNKDLLNNVNNYFDKNQIYIVNKHCNMYYASNVYDSLNVNSFHCISENSRYYDSDIKIEQYVYLKSNLYYNINTKSVSNLKNIDYTFQNYSIEKEYLNIKINTSADINNLFKFLKNYTIYENIFTIERANNSCGIINVNGVNNINFSKEYDKKHYSYYLYINENTIELNFKNKNILLEFLIKHIRILCKNKFSRSSIITFSTNVDRNNNIDDINLLFNAFKEFEIISLDTYNDNSKNNITTKIYDYKQFINIDNE